MAQIYFNVNMSSCQLLVSKRGYYQNLLAASVQGPDTVTA
jgi:hypothetical protein